VIAAAFEDEIVAEVAREVTEPARDIRGVVPDIDERCSLPNEYTLGRGGTADTTAGTPLGNNRDGVAIILGRAVDVTGRNGVTGVGVLATADIRIDDIPPVVTGRFGVDGAVIDDVSTLPGSANDANSSLLLPLVPMVDARAIESRNDAAAVNASIRACNVRISLANRSLVADNERLLSSNSFFSVCIPNIIVAAAAAVLLLASCAARASPSVRMNLLSLLDEGDDDGVAS
jgi:hypothetical protein